MTEPNESGALPDQPGTVHVCKDCGGIFMNPQPDGGPYEHTCPEKPAAEMPPTARKWWQLPRRPGAEERGRA